MGRAIDPAQVEATLKDHPKVKLVAFVHAETSTGVASDAKAICGIAGKAGCLTIVDCVTSLAGIDVALDDWGADAAYSGTQKCLSCAPGLSPLSMSERAIEAIKVRNHPVASWFLDMNLVMGYWGENTTRAIIILLRSTHSMGYIRVYRCFSKKGWRLLGVVMRCIIKL